MAVIDTVTSPAGESIPIVDGEKQGFGALDSQAFLKMLITQLQNQDPTEPVSNEELLSQLSEMRSLQSSIELEEVLQKMTASQNAAATASFASSSASLIGKHVTGSVVDPETEEVTPVEGEVDRAVLRDGKAYVGIGDVELPIDRIEAVRQGG